MSDVEIEVNATGIVSEIALPEKVKPGYQGVESGDAPVVTENTLGQVVYNGVVLAQFENPAQAIMSMYYTGFAPYQILSVMPQCNEYTEASLLKLITGKAKKSSRYGFVKYLAEADARKLFESEYLAIVKVVGKPAGKAKTRKMIKTRAMITADIENIELLKPKVSKPRSSTGRVAKEMSREDAQEVAEQIDSRLLAVRLKLQNQNNDFAEAKARYDTMNEGPRKAVLGHNLEIMRIRINNRIASIEKMENSLQTIREKYSL